MAVTLGLVLALYAAIVLVLGLLVVVLDTRWVAVVTIVALVVFATVAVHMDGASGLLLRASGAEPLDDRTLTASLARLSQLAGLRPPSLSILETSTANAFTVGTRAQNSRIVVTSGLLDALDPAELEAVLAHELAHIANHDAAVMTFSSVPRMIGETMIGEQEPVSYIWTLVWWIGIPLWALGSVLTLALSRYREFAADRGSALLTGRPETLMSALEKLVEPDRRIPIDDLRLLGRVEALCIVASGGTRLTLFSDHPPLGKRLEQLSLLAREMGRPVP
jgi:heat shock protein HtpX